METLLRSDEQATTEGERIASDKPTRAEAEAAVRTLLRTTRRVKA